MNAIGLLIFGIPLSAAGLGWMAYIFYTYGRDHPIQPPNYPRFSLIFALTLMPLLWATYLIYVTIVDYDDWYDWIDFCIPVVLLLGVVLLPVCRLNFQDSKRLALPFVASTLLVAAGICLFKQGFVEAISPYDFFGIAQVVGWELVNETHSTITIDFDQCEEAAVLTNCTWFEEGSSSNLYGYSSWYGYGYGGRDDDSNAASFFYDGLESLNDGYYYDFTCSNGVEYKHYDWAGNDDDDNADGDDADFDADNYPMALYVVGKKKSCEAGWATNKMYRRSYDSFYGQHDTASKLLPLGLGSAACALLHFLFSGRREQDIDADTSNKKTELLPVEEKNDTTEVL